MCGRFAKNCKELGSDLGSSYDRLEHYGGEEFFIMASGCSWNGAMDVAVRIRSAISAEPVNKWRIPDRRAT